MISQLPSPRIIDPASVPSLRWGVVGTGSIARKFTHALHTHTQQRAAAVAARDKARTASFAASLGIDTVFSSVEAMVSDPNIDVVYIATPHSTHSTIALQAIAGGKHVLIEKPLAISAAEATKVSVAARAAGVFAMEAMWTRYLPQLDVVHQLVASGAIGEVELVMADFGYVAPFDPHHRMWDPALGGGALLDAGVYPLSFTSSIIGPPTTMHVSGAMASTGVDARAAIQIATASGATALVATSMTSALPARGSIIGPLGRIELLSPFFTPTGVQLMQGEFHEEHVLEWVDHSVGTMHEGLGYQATALAHYVSEGLTESPLHGLDEAVSVLATIDEARRQIALTGTGAP